MRRDTPSLIQPFPQFVDARCGLLVTDDTQPLDVGEAEPALAFHRWGAAEIEVGDLFQWASAGTPEDR